MGMMIVRRRKRTVNDAAKQSAEVKSAEKAKKTERKKKN